ncbi:MAG: hypothetical protein AAFP97_07100 [Pseudomonadota bacterium]
MDLSAFIQSPPIIQIHAVSATAALIGGISLFVLPKGRKWHRWIGIFTAVCLVETTFTALFITHPSRGHWSALHWTIPFTTFWIVLVLFALNQKRWPLHRWAGRITVVGTLIIPFLAAVLIPDRMMYDLVFG